MYKLLADAEKISKENKEDTAFFNLLGHTYFARGKCKEAIKAFKQVIRIDPDDADAHICLGFAYGETGMNKEAIEAYKQAIKLKPDNAEAHFCVGRYNLGVVYADLGMNKEAIEAFKQAIRIKPDNAEAHYCLGLAHSILNDRGSALEQYKILKDLDPQRANELLNLIYK